MINTIYHLITMLYHVIDLLLSGRLTPGIHALAPRHLQRSLHGICP